MASGESRPRVNARRLVRGRGRYADDLRIGGLAHAVFVRSPHAHARLLAVDLEPARQCEGVIAAFDAQALATICKPWQTHLATFPAHQSLPQGPLASDRALWHGQPVAIVIARTRALAEDAAAQVLVDYEPLPAAAVFPAVLEPGSPLAHPALASNIAFEHRIAAGDPQTAFSQAHHVVRRRFGFSRNTAVSLEPRTLVAEFDPSLSRLTVHASTQVPNQLRTILAAQLGLSEASVRVICPDVGGGFGAKLHCYDDEMAVCAAAVRLGMPVKFAADRLESMASDIHGRGHQVDAALALDAQGRILAIEVDDAMEAGAHSVYPRSSILEGLQSSGFVAVAYALDHYAARLRVAWQNKIGTASYRGVGQPVACAVTEYLLDAAAREMALDPAELRRRNFRTASRGGDRTPAGFSAGGLSHEACLDRLLELMDYPSLRARQQAARAAGRHLGIGIASFVEQNSPGAAFYGAAGVGISAMDGATLRLEPDGSVTCITSNVDQGQGVETTLAQLVAEMLGIDPAQVRIAQGDTLFAPMGGGIFASRGLTIAGEAALAAAERLRGQLLATAAALWGCPAESLVWREGAVHRVDAADSLGLAQLGRVLNFEQHRLPAGMEPASLASAQVIMQQPFLLANGAQASLVEVDPDTGVVHLLGHWLVEDCGRVINPLLADEQLRGGVVQGIGAALYEECRYDDEGQIVTGTLADYLLPMAGEMPDIVIGHVETPLTGTRLGGKGVGEAGTIGAAAAVGNAINDALAPLGAEVCQQPFTPERILRALGRVA
jgi:carbon-monoxide dehydrogenase large subunit